MEKDSNTQSENFIKCLAKRLKMDICLFGNGLGEMRIMGVDAIWRLGK